MIWGPCLKRDLCRHHSAPDVIMLIVLPSWEFFDNNIIRETNFILWKGKECWNILEVFFQKVLDFLKRFLKIWMCIAGCLAASVACTH